MSRPDASSTIATAAVVRAKPPSEPRNAAASTDGEHPTYHPNRRRDHILCTNIQELSFRTASRGESSDGEGGICIWCRGRSSKKQSWHANSPLIQIKGLQRLQEAMPNETARVFIYRC